MKEKLAILATVALLALGLSGCMTTGNHQMMDKSMQNQTQTMEKDTMHHGTMSGAMEPKKDDKTDNTMAAPMKNNMKNGDMPSDMSGSMK